MSAAKKYAPIVAQRLLNREDVSTATEIQAGRGWRLAATIHYLRLKGWPILTQLDMKRIAHYRLPPGWSLADLNAPGNAE